MILLLYCASRIFKTRYVAKRDSALWTDETADFHFTGHLYKVDPTRLCVRWWYTVRTRTVPEYDHLIVYHSLTNQLPELVATTEHYNIQHFFGYQPAYGTAELLCQCVGTKSCNDATEEFHEGRLKVKYWQCTRQCGVPYYQALRVHDSQEYSHKRSLWVDYDKTSELKNFRSTNFFE